MREKISSSRKKMFPESFRVVQKLKAVRECEFISFRDFFVINTVRQREMLYVREKRDRVTEREKGREREGERER